MQSKPTQEDRYVDRIHTAIEQADARTVKLIEACGRCFRQREPEPIYCWNCDGAGMVTNPGAKSGVARCLTCKGEGELPAGSSRETRLASETDQPKEI